MIYAAKICGNRPRLHIRINLTWYIFGGDGIAQSLFSEFTACQSLESTCIGLIGSNNFFNLQQQIVCIIVCHVDLTRNTYYPQIRKLDKSGNWKNNYKEYLMPPKIPKYAKHMQYAHFAKICEKCGKVPNMRQSHIRVFLTCLSLRWHRAVSPDAHSGPLPQQLPRYPHKPGYSHKSVCDQGSYHLLCVEWDIKPY